MLCVYNQTGRHSLCFPQELSSVPTDFLIRDYAYLHGTMHGERLDSENCTFSIR